MPVVLALPLLFDAVVSDMAAAYARRTPAAEPPPHAFGWREPARQMRAPRVVWVPGDDGDLGTIGPARNPGRNPRPLATIHELATIYVEGYDPSAPEDERAQYTAARLLFDDLLASLYRVAHGTIELGRARWVDDKTVRRHGATLRLVVAIEAMVPDEPAGLAPTDAAAIVTSYPSADSDDEGETDTVSAG